MVMSDPAERARLIEKYVNLGLVPMPLVAGTKIPKIVGWNERPRDELLAAFHADDNVGLRIEPPFFVIDIDDRRLVPLILDEIPASAVIDRDGAWVSQTALVETRRGMHVYLFADEYYPTTNKRTKFIQLLADGCQVAAPPSIVDGHKYKFLTDLRIIYVNSKTVKILERIVEAIATYEPLIIEFARAWQEGHRHNLALWLAGALRKAGVDKFDAAVVIKAICLLADDGEMRNRLNAVKDTYEKPIGEIAAWSRLEAELKTIFGENEASRLITLIPQSRPAAQEWPEEMPADIFTAEGALDVEKFLEIADNLPGDIVFKNPLRIMKIDAVPVVTELGAEYVNRYRVFEGNIFSCRRVWRDNPPRTAFAGFMMIGDEKVRYESAIRVPLGRRRVLGRLELVSTKKTIRPLLKILAYEQEKELTTDWRPSSLSDVRACFPRLVGEDMNVALLILALASRLNLNRDFWIMGVVLQGESSAGKSYLASQVLEPFRLLGRVEEFTRFTGPYLERRFRGRNMDDVILLIYELGENVPQQLHLSLSEGKLRVGLVDRETGEALEYEFEGMPFLLSTTPLEHLRPDLRNRVIVTSIDESEEQTKRILEYETWLAKNGAAKLLDKQTEEAARQFAAYFRTLKPAAVAVPWADKLYSRLTFYNTKLRRDWKKLFALIQASALLFQHDRQVEEHDGVRVIYADKRDFENLMFVMPVFATTLQNLTPAQRKIVEVLEDTNLDVMLTLKEIMSRLAQRKIRLSPKRVYEVLNELEVLGYVVIEREGRQNKYARVRMPESIDFSDVF